MEQSPRSRKKTQINDELLSLPNNVIDNILSRLPLKQAFRTSVLSSAWRYQWTNLSKFIFDSHNLGLLPRKCQWKDRTVLENGKIVQVVDQALLHCKGPIHMFGLHISDIDTSNLDRWIPFLSGKGIRHFSYKNSLKEYYKVHSSLFSCSEMVYLALKGCTLRIPASFTGFSKLINLSLFNIMSTDGSLHNLISNCPLLKKLTLSGIHGCTILRLCNPNLVDLQLQLKNSFDNIYFENTPVLTRASFNLVDAPRKDVADGGTCRLVNLLSGLPSIKKLQLRHEAYQVLSAGIVPVRLPTPSQLIHLFLDINFNNMQHMLVALCIFRSSSLLQNIVINSTSVGKVNLSVQDIWEAHKDTDALFRPLQKLTVRNFVGTKGALKFIDFALANAPILQMLQIELKAIEDAENILTEVQRFWRQLSNAEIEVQHNKLAISLPQKLEEWDN